jgi:hypothetical protein
LDYYGGSWTKALKEIFKEYEWLPWKFVPLPKNFFEDPSNRRDYIRWFENMCGIHKPEDWYQVSASLICSFNGYTLLQHAGK